MISVLIPTYNFDVSKLITEIHSQLLAAKTEFEIIVFEDGTAVNSETILSNTKIIFHPENVGRLKARTHLAKEAKYKWLLFLDADVLPKSEAFISNYINAIILKYDAYFGGFAYYENKPESNTILRWKYGRLKEQIAAKARNKNEYKVIISANYLIKKNVFKTINSQIKSSKNYGFDVFFGALLKQGNYNVLHLDNEVYHLGIEENEVYLKKAEQAVLTLLDYFKNNNKLHSNDLLTLFSKIHRLKVVWIFSGFYKLFNKSMRNHLLSKNPKIVVFQFYRLCFMCYSYKNAIA